MAGFNVLDPGISLSGRFFLEASAGTGKTFAIEHLAIRSMLERGLTLKEMLFVTFTKKATSELKERLRSRLEETIDNFESEGPLNGYLSTYSNKSASERYLAKASLIRALSNFEEAKIFTLHGFCSYILQKEGFLSPLFLENVEKLDLFEQITKDVLREGSLFSPKQLSKLMSDHGADLGKLIFAIRHLVEKRTPIAYGASYDESHAEFSKKATVLIHEFSLSKDQAIEDLLALAPSYKEMSDRSRSLKKEKETAIIAFVENLFERRALPDPLFGMQRHELLKSAKMPKSPLFYPGLLERLQSDIFPIIEQAYDPFFLTSRLAEEVRKKIEISKEKVVFFEDLLLKMEEAIEFPGFIESVRAEFSAIFIDEFQDVDAKLWKIFTKLFVEDEKSERALFLIGDPKQSIYRFRKADLYTYLAAKNIFPKENTLSLSTNYRSRPELTEALNTFFAPASTLFSPPKFGSKLPFTTLVAGRETKEPFSDGKSFIHFILGKTEKELFETILNEVTSLYEGGKKLSDCAILVRDRFQGARFLKYADARKIPAISSRSRLLTESRAFSFLQDLIYGALYPRDRERINKLFLGPYFSLCSQEEKPSLFFRIAKLLKEEGILAFFQGLVSEMKLLESILNEKDGLELYSDLHQLVEMLAENTTPLAALDYLEDLKNKDENLSPSARILGRTDALQILTIHASKGLEFDIVFPVGLTITGKKYHELILDTEKKHLTFSEKAFEEHLNEESSEEMRLLYVACTRARERLYLTIPEKAEGSPLGRFLDERLKGMTLEVFVASQKGFSLTHADISMKAFQAREAPVLALEPPRMPSLEYSPRYQNSFSQMRERSDANLVKKEISSVKSSIKLHGAQFGSFCHSLLEKIPLKLAFSKKSLEEFSDFLKPYMASSIYQEESPYISELIYHALNTTLENPGGAFKLSDIDPEKCFREMEFLYTSGDGNFTKGFIDLVFEYQNNIYFVDWKTHDLGDSKEDYNASHLSEIVERDGYHLQAAIYKEAIARYFSLFDNKKEIIGFFIFLRGLMFKESNGVFSF